MSLIPVFCALHVLCVDCGEAPQVDAFFDEWSDVTPIPLKRVTSGSLSSASDLSATLQLAVAQNRLFVALQVEDDAFQFGTKIGGDRFRMTLGNQEIRVVLNNLEDHPPQVLLNQKPLKSAQIHGTSRVNGWAFELSVPLSLLPDLEKPFSFSALLQDCDATPGKIEAVVETEPGESIKIDGSLGLLDAYEQDRGPLEQLQHISGKMGTALPIDFYAGEHDVVAMGRGLPDGSSYLYFTHGWRPTTKILDMRLITLPGRSEPVLLLVHREWAIMNEFEVDVLEIYGFEGGYFKRLLAQKLAERDLAQHVSLESNYKLTAKGLEISPAKSMGYNQGNYLDVDENAGLPYDAMLLPWSFERPKIFRFIRGRLNRE